MQEFNNSSLNKTLFVTVGSTRFDNLINRITQHDILELLVEHNFNKLILQVGNGEHDSLLDLNDTYLIGNKLKVVVYRYKTSLEQDLDESNMVISHAGAGSIIESLERDKKLLVIINETLMHNHQFELAHKMQSLGYCSYATCSTLYDNLNNLFNQKCKLVKYTKGKPNEFGKFLNNFLK